MAERLFIIFWICTCIRNVYRSLDRNKYEEHYRDNMKKIEAGIDTVRIYAPQLIFYVCIFAVSICTLVELCAIGLFIEYHNIPLIIKYPIIYWILLIISIIHFITASKMQYNFLKFIINPDINPETYMNDALFSMSDMAYNFHLFELWAMVLTGVITFLALL